MDKISSLFNVVEHNSGIALITVAFIYALVTTLRSGKALMPYQFYLLYGIGGALIFAEMLDQQKPFVIVCELIGFPIALYLAYHSYKHSTARTQS